MSKINNTGNKLIYNTFCRYETHILFLWSKIETIAYQPPQKATERK